MRDPVVLYEHKCGAGERRGAVSGIRTWEDGIKKFLGGSRGYFFTRAVFFYAC